MRVAVDTQSIHRSFVSPDPEDRTVVNRLVPSIRQLFRGLFARLSIRNKLVVIVSLATTVSLTTGFLAVVLTSLEQFEEDLIRSTEVIARSVGTYSAVALAFDDLGEADNSLAALETEESVTSAVLFNLDGSVFKAWHQTGTERFIPQDLHDVHSEIRDGQVHIFRPVVFEGRRYGTIYVQATAESLDERRRTYLIYMGLLLVGLVVFSVFMAYGLQGLISRPILSLAAKARQISDHADYSVRVRKPGNDEIGVLYDGFNEMLEQIQRRQEELERSNRDLDQFAYVASHDLKAPLRAISTLSAWIEEDLDDKISSDERDQLRLLRSRVQRMDSLIEGILQYSRAGRTATGIETVDTRQMAAEIVDILSLPAGLQVTLSDDLPILETRKLRLEQVIQNLVTNAVKYHHDPENGHIEIGCKQEGAERWRFWVQDDGPGIAEEHHDRVFLMFQTLQPRDRVESTGLGLSLVTKLVEEEGGRVRLISAEGEGARFEFTWNARRGSVKDLDVASDDAESGASGDGADRSGRVLAGDDSRGRSLRVGRREGGMAQVDGPVAERSHKNADPNP